MKHAFNLPMDKSLVSLSRKLETMNRIRTANYKAGFCSKRIRHHSNISKQNVGAGFVIFGSFLDGGEGGGGGGVI